MTNADGHATESLCSATETFSHTKQLLHQYHKILALCNIKGELASSFSLNIAHSQYFVVLMKYLINIDFFNKMDAKANLTFNWQKLRRHFKRLKQEYQMPSSLIQHIVQKADASQ